MEHPVSPQLMRPSIRRVVSQIDLRRKFDALAGTLTNSNGQLSCSETLKAENSRLQKRIEELESSKSAMEVDLESKQVTVQQLVAALQSLQTANDKLAEERNHICRVPEDSNISALDQQTAAALAAVEERKSVQQELECAMNANHALSASLATAQNHAMFCEGRMVELYNAVDKSPNEVANISGVIEQKDKLFSDLENRAGECLTALDDLEERRGEGPSLVER